MTSTNHPPVRRWAPLELTVDAGVALENPLQAGRLEATFTGPSGQIRRIDGFWDGGTTWRVRFAPDEEGRWHYRLQWQGRPDVAFTPDQGHFDCVAPAGQGLFQRHGPVRLAAHKRHLEHADGTPFFWLADTAWNGPLRATDDEWAYYLQVRTRQRFTAVQWVATQWRAAPDGDRDGRLAFTGRERIAVNPEFFQRLDRRVAAMAQAGLLSVPVLLWAVGGGTNPEVDPGYGLPEDQAILLARYMVARWGAWPVVWILAGDGKYFGDYAARWRRIGRAVFGDGPRAPVAMHCGGQQWPADELRGEPWLDILGYQSGHGDSAETWRWLVEGPPAREWGREPRLFQLNLEPAYENHVAYHSGQPHSAQSVRQAIYWSLLNAPTAGVSYGGHGVWGWDDGSGPPVDHPRSGTPLPWREALEMPAATQMAHLADCFTGLAWTALRPRPDLLVEQPGREDVTRTVLVSASDAGDLVVAYTPQPVTLRLRTAELAAGLAGTWWDPRTGTQHPLDFLPAGEEVALTTPGAGDWLLILQPRE
ncbi:DUF4038 domain-containing protein [Litorilinea aerophila]|uniref:DUF4038 domain-containing protein n=1 Tax=Litorilinea aerophila TaxID=1204385 RepID=A0A540VGQ9_9CHLR|nr:DUF4038 domain-containing protein [Litorilinea aerophila]MCC9076333.1 DUF4038 domain-containing protein [Litorilinea aerophila]